jgi:hypothetical protein
LLLPERNRPDGDVSDAAELPAMLDRMTRLLDAAAIPSSPGLQ